MTDVSKAMELLELAKKWLEPFGVTDPFSKLQLEGYLSLKPDYRYGALALLKVGGQETPQRILATPKLHYPFDRNGAFHFPSVKEEWGSGFPYCRFALKVLPISAQGRFG